MMDIGRRGAVSRKEIDKGCVAQLFERAKIPSRLSKEKRTLAAYLGTLY